MLLLLVLVLMLHKDGHCALRSAVCVSAAETATAQHLSQSADPFSLSLVHTRCQQQQQQRQMLSQKAHKNASVSGAASVKRYL